MRDVHLQIALDGKNKEVYDMVARLMRIKYENFMSAVAKTVNYACILALFVRLRQCAIAPYLLTAESKRDQLTAVEKQGDADALRLITENKAGGDVIRKWCSDIDGEAGIKSPKIREICEIIQRIRTNKHEKMVVFSKYASVLDLIGYAIDQTVPGCKYLQFDGSTKNRGAVIEKFKTDPSIDVLLLTYSVGGEGINLTEAKHCILVEPWWTEAVHSQAKSRLWRIGQTSTVICYHVQVIDTVEARVYEICKRKQDMADSYLAETASVAKSMKIDKETIGYIIGARK